MELTGKIAERYVTAVEWENRRNELFNLLLAEQIGPQRPVEIERLNSEIAALDGPGDL